MRPSIRSALAFAAAVMVAVPVAAAVAAPAPRSTAGDDAVVIAVIDSGISPYHWDYLASKMPQAETATRADDLPLHRSPDTWLRGFPSRKSFASFDALKLSLDARNPKADPAKLYEKDKVVWADVSSSGAQDISYHWIPGTKVIGALAFGRPAAPAAPIYGEGTGEHGMGTSSVSVGNLYGTCPECLLVFIQANAEGDYERAIEWAARQPWIDAISNSYGISTTPVIRDRVYAGSDTSLQRTAIQRGQEILFSAGNGMLNDFVTPNGTLLSSQEGPDWITTVGATEPAGVDYAGSGKPADVAGIGSAYPSGYGATTVTNGANFSGTSNATPTIAGTYGRGLWLARRKLSGPSRVQSGGVVAVGAPVKCGVMRSGCELRDGKLTRRELEHRLFRGATPTKGGYAGRRTVPRSVANGLVPIPPPVGGYPLPFVTTPAVADERFASEGYGTYRARLDGTAKWLTEFNARFWEVLTGDRAEPERPAGEVEWFRVDSWCRQHIWGEWQQGKYVNDTMTPLPGPDPMFPTRNAYYAGCQGLTKPPT